MDHNQAIEALNCLLRILYRSLPMYLYGKRLWSPRGKEVGHIVDDIVGDYQTYIQRIADTICQWDGCLQPGQFPLDFTSMHDLSLEYLLKELIDRQKRDVIAIRQCVEDVSGFPEVQTLAEEVLGNARGHLDNLEELATDDHPVGA